MYVDVFILVCSGVEGIDEDVIRYTEPVVLNALIEDCFSR